MLKFEILSCLEAQEIHLESQVTFTPTKNHHFTPLYTQSTPTLFPLSNTPHPLPGSVQLKAQAAQTPLISTLQPREKREKLREKEKGVQRSFTPFFPPKHTLLALPCAYPSHSREAGWPTSHRISSKSISRQERESRRQGRAQRRRKGESTQKK